jgi:hypothetical protein
MQRDALACCIELVADTCVSGCLLGCVYHCERLITRSIAFVLLRAETSGNCAGTRKSAKLRAVMFALRLDPERAGSFDSLGLARQLRLLETKNTRGLIGLIRMNVGVCQRSGTALGWRPKLNTSEL